MTSLELIPVVASELRAEILKRWPTYYPARAGCASPAVNWIARECGFSVIFKVDLDFGNGRDRERCVVKIRRQQRNGSFLRRDMSERTLALSRAEYEEHVRAYGFFSERRDGLSVVRPLDFIDSHSALVVDHAIGTDLSKLVREDARDAKASLERCGLWWRLFHHDLHASRARAWDPVTVDRALERRLKRLRAVGAPPGALESLERETQMAARGVPQVPVPVSLIHGDCKLRHVWATADGIQVLDFGNTKTGDSWIDPAALVVELSLFSLWSRRLDSGPKAADIQTLVRAYFDGAPPRAFSLYVVDCLLKKWHRRLRSWGSKPGLRQLRESLKAVGLDGPFERLYIDRWFTAQIRAWLEVAEGRPPAWLRPVVE